MKRIFALLILAAATLGAQNLTTTGNITAQASACVAGGGAPGYVWYLIPPKASSVGVVLSGTWSGTVTFSSSVDGVNWVTTPVAPIAGGSTVTTTTANGSWSFSPGGVLYVCAYASSYASGTVAVSMTSNTGGGTPSGTAGGDLSGTYPNPTVAKINGVALPTLAASTGLLYDSNGTLGLQNYAPNLTGAANSGWYNSATNTTSAIASGNNGVIATNGSGVPAVTSTLPSGVTSTPQTFTASGSTAPAAFYNPNANGDIILGTNSSAYTTLGRSGSTGRFLMTTSEGYGFELQNGITMVDGIVQGGGSQTITGCSLTAAVGGSAAGKFVSGTTGTCTVTITPALGIATVNGFTCWANDLTTVADTLHQTGTISATTATISGTTVSGDIITWGCNAF